ncbi:MAG: sugar kinase, partial [Acidimicrobiales bacterium]
PEHTIGASYGDALLAAIGSGLVPPETDWARNVTTVVPNVESQAVYDDLYSAYCDLYPASVKQIHLLARLQETSAG